MVDPTGSGIYAIFAPSGNCYIGSAQDISVRWYHHKYNLLRGNHHCHALDKAAKKYGMEKLVFVALENCDKQDLIEREQFWMDELAPAYNSLRTATGISALCRAKASWHMKKLNQQPWTNERREKARQHMRSAQLFRRNKPWTKERRLAQSNRMKQRHANGTGPWEVHKANTLYQKG